MLSANAPSALYYQPLPIALQPNISSGADCHALLLRLVLSQALGNASLLSGNEFVSQLDGSNRLAAQFKEVAKVVQLDTIDFDTERSMFYTTFGGRRRPVFRFPDALWFLLVVFYTTFGGRRCPVFCFPYALW
jgi:hypothetical protein